MKGAVVRAAGTVLVAVLLGLTAGRPASAATSLEGIPAYDHVFVLVLENESFSSTFGPGSPAHYLNDALVAQGVLADQYYGIGHISLDNYVAMTSAQPLNPLTASDCLAVSLYDCAQTTLAFSNGANLGDQFDAANLSWKGYMDGMPSACFHQAYAPTTQGADPYQGNSQTPPAKDYADRHNPFLYYPDIVSNDTRCQAHDVPYTQLSGDLAGGTVPNFAFVTPDTCHDGHDAPCSGGAPGGLVSADAWLQTEVPPILAYVNAHNGLLIITSDESTNSDLSGCCHGGPGGQAGAGGRIGLLALGPSVKAGQVVHTQYDHASLVRTVEDVFAISAHLNNAAQSLPMRDLFIGPDANVPDAPVAAALLMPAAAAVLVAARRRRLSAASTRS